ncbi:hypothetical protein ACI2KS_01480 [Pseudomonas sp. NPDC087358]
MERPNARHPPDASPVAVRLAGGIALDIATATATASKPHCYRAGIARF